MIQGPQYSWKAIREDVFQEQEIHSILFIVEKMIPESEGERLQERRKNMELRTYHVTCLLISIFQRHRKHIIYTDITGIGLRCSGT